MQGQHLPEDGEEAGGDVVAIYGDGCDLVIIKPGPLSPPVLPTSGQSVLHVSSGCGINPLEHFLLVTFKVFKDSQCFKIIFYQLFIIELATSITASSQPC